MSGILLRSAIFSALGICGFLATFWLPCAAPTVAAEQNPRRQEHHEKAQPSEDDVPEIGIPRPTDLSEGCEILPPLLLLEWKKFMPHDLYVHRLLDFLRALPVEDVRKVLRMTWAWQVRGSFFFDEESAIVLKALRERNSAAAAGELIGRLTWEQRAQVGDEDLDLEGDASEVLAELMNADYEGAMRILERCPPGERRSEFVFYIVRSLWKEGNPSPALVGAAADARLSEEERSGIRASIEFLKANQHPKQVDLNKPLIQLLDEAPSSEGCGNACQRVRKLMGENPAGIWSELSGIPDEKMRAAVVKSVFENLGGGAEKSLEAIETFLNSIPEGESRRWLASIIYREEFDPELSDPLVKWLEPCAASVDELNWLKRRQISSREDLAHTLAAGDPQLSSARAARYAQEIGRYLGADGLAYLAQAPQDAPLRSKFVSGWAASNLTAALQWEQQQPDARQLVYGIREGLPAPQAEAASYLLNDSEYFQALWRKSNRELDGAMRAAAEIPDPLLRAKCLSYMIETRSNKAEAIARKLPLPGAEVDALIEKAGASQ